LYDLDGDPRERASIFNQDHLMSLDTLTGDYLEMENVGGYTSSQFDSTQIEELKAIGYLQGFESQSSEPATEESQVKEKDKP